MARGLRLAALRLAPKSFLAAMAGRRGLRRRVRLRLRPARVFLAALFFVARLDLDLARLFEAFCFLRTFFSRRRFARAFIFVRDFFLAVVAFALVVRAFLGFLTLFTCPVRHFALAEAGFFVSLKLDNGVKPMPNIATRQTHNKRLTMFIIVTAIF